MKPASSAARWSVRGVLCLLLLAVGLQLARTFVLSSSPWQRARGIERALEPTRIALTQIVVPAARTGDPQALEERRDELAARVHSLGHQLEDASALHAGRRDAPDPGAQALELARWAERSGLTLLALERKEPRPRLAGSSALEGLGSASSAEWRLELAGGFEALRALWREVDGARAQPVPQAFSIESHGAGRALRVQLWLVEELEARAPSAGALQALREEGR